MKKLLMNVDWFQVGGYLFFILTTIYFMFREKKVTKKAAVKLKATVDSGKTEAYALYPKIDAAKCGACGVCTKVCPEGDILQMINHLPVLVSPTKCVGHSLCYKSCPYDAITMVFGTEENGKQVPNYDENYETNVKGLYIAGELGGMGLISNAIRQGVCSAQHALKNLDPSLSTDTDVLVVGAGPAGIAAALTCIEKKIKYRCIDQNSFGGTVFNYPRQKLVMSHPASLPIVGKMSFPKNKVVKEDLLKYWQNARQKTGLKVEERVKFVNLKVENKIFMVETSAGIIKAKKVILAVGVGGTPRKLGLQNEDSEKVSYKLVDPEQYKGKKICVVGAGDSAIEAAQRVADKKYNNTVHLIVRADSLSRCKEDNKNKIERMEKQGLLKIFYVSEVKEIHADRLVLSKKGEKIEIPNDYLILFMGTIPPFDFLKGIGIGIRTLHGEPLSKAA